MTMKKLFPIAVFLLLVLAGCDSQKKEAPQDSEPQPEQTKESASATADWDGFWETFNSAVQNNDIKKTTALTVMPLKGHHHGALDANHFASHFNDIFDQKVKETFAKANDRNFVKLMISTPEQAAAMNAPLNTEVWTINVQYIYDAGTESQTESTTVFIFGKSEGEFKLLSLLQAG